MKITMICADNWVWVYKDGFLVHEDHQIEAYRLLEILGIESDTLWTDDMDSGSLLDNETIEEVMCYSADKLSDWDEYR